MSSIGGKILGIRPISSEAPFCNGEKKLVLGVKVCYSTDIVNIPVRGNLSPASSVYDAIYHTRDRARHTTYYTVRILASNQPWKRQSCMRSLIIIPRHQTWWTFNLSTRDYYNRLDFYNDM